MRAKLDYIESRLQALIEGSITMLLPYGNPQRALAHQLVESMQANLFTLPDGRLKAPDLYHIHINPTRSQFWQANQAFVEDLGQVLFQAGSEAGFTFAQPPSLSLVTDERLAPHEIVIVAAASEDHLSDTASLPVEPDALNGESEGPAPANAFLIVNGTETYPLRLPVFNIGRRLDNHLVLDDPRVSRSHAQLRAIKGRYVLFDLNSTGGTVVNGRRISQAVLNPGDVISLAGVPLIYGQDFATGISDTSAFPPYPGPKDSVS
jgi:hypothetical protein